MMLDSEVLDVPGKNIQFLLNFFLLYFLLNLIVNFLLKFPETYNYKTMSEGQIVYFCN